MKKKHPTPITKEGKTLLPQSFMIPKSLPVSDDEVEIIGSKSRNAYDEDEEEMEFIEIMENETNKNVLW